MVYIYMVYIYGIYIYGIYIWYIFAPFCTTISLGAVRAMLPPFSQQHLGDVAVRDRRRPDLGFNENNKGPVSIDTHTIFNGKFHYK